MQSTQVEEMILDLVRRINRFNEAYYQSGDSGLEDAEFDIMLDQLRKLEDQYPQFRLPDSPTIRVGGDPTGTFENVRHNFPMLSLSNLYSENDLHDWITSVLTKISPAKVLFSCEVKIDGVAISIIYQEGSLIQAVTRGNGEIGDEVTKNVRTIRSLPLELDRAVSLQLRGEIFLPINHFKAMNEKKQRGGDLLFKNPRNAAAGSIRMKDPKAVAKRGLEVLLWDIVEGQPTQNHSENLDFVQSLNIPVNPFRAVCRNAEEILSFCQKWEREKENLPFEIDGVVIKVENLGMREQLGVTAKSPRWATAWKFKAEQGRTRLLSIENSIGRTGILTPVANLEPVQLQGTEVKRATLHNYDQINRLGIFHNDAVFVEKGGEIIPKIIGVDYTLRKENSIPIRAPINCPECDSKLIRLDQEVDLRCDNPNCPAVIAGRLEHFVSKKAMDIQFLGSALIKTLITEGLIEKIPDIYRLKDYQSRLIGIEGLGKKSVENLLSAIERSKATPLNQFIYALGVRHIGEKAARSLALKSDSIAGFLRLSESDMESMADFGPIMNASLLNWIGNEDNTRLVETLIQLGVDPSPLKKPKMGDFQVQTIVITGSLSKPRPEWKQLLENQGFKVTGAVSKNTTFLLTGENPGSKLTKAQNLGVTILQETELEELLNRSTLTPEDH